MSVHADNRHVHWARCLPLGIRDGESLHSRDTKCAIACCLILQAQTKDAPKTTDVLAFMNNNGHKLAAAVVEIAGVTKAASQPKARYTFLL